MNVRRWFHEHSLKLLAIRDTPGAIAGGVGIGVFFGFVPVIGLKTVLAITLAWLTRSNILAAVLAATAHEILFPLMPFIYFWQYRIGYWILSDPHQWPQAMHRSSWAPHEWWKWKTFVTIGKPLLLGSVICSAPVALLSFFITKTLIVRHRRKKSHGPDALLPDSESP
jgi:uncharacterized protein (DUF2062 family)